MKKDWKGLWRMMLVLFKKYEDKRQTVKVKLNLYFFLNKWNPKRKTISKGRIKLKCLVSFIPYSLNVHLFLLYVCNLKCILILKICIVVYSMRINLKILVFYKNKNQRFKKINIIKSWKYVIIKQQNIFLPI